MLLLQVEHLEERSEVVDQHVRTTMMKDLSHLRDQQP
jgi:hypothetical protein